VWKEVGQGLIQREVQSTVKFGGGNIMVWGCMSWEGVGRLAEVEGKMDADQYVDILKENLLPSMEESSLSMEECIWTMIQGIPPRKPKLGWKTIKSLL